MQGQIRGATTYHMLSVSDVHEKIYVFRGRSDQISEVKLIKKLSEFSAAIKFSTAIKDETVFI